MGEAPIIRKAVISLPSSRHGQNFMLPIGKIPVQLLERILPKGNTDPRLLLGPGIGIDCAVVDFGDRLLAIKSDPITFVSEAVGWYAVQVNANDIASVGATPCWFLPTLLLPEKTTTPQLVEGIMDQIGRACEALGINIIGGHTEVTHGLDRPVVAGTMVGELTREQLVRPQDVQEHDRLLLTKGVPIEGTIIMAREFENQLSANLGPGELQRAKDFLFSPGISVVKDAQIARAAGRVHAMHDPTEGGVAAALWELAAACGKALVVERDKIPVPGVSRRICNFFKLDPLATIASGALLLSVHQEDVPKIRSALRKAGIPCSVIGWVESGPPVVYALGETRRSTLQYPERDEIASLFENS